MNGFRFKYRAVIVSPPVSDLIKLSFSLAPSSVSSAVTNRLPLRLAVSGVALLPPAFFAMSASVFVLIP